jgi:ubiquitin-protein ligase
VSVAGQVDESLDRLEADILGPNSSPYRGGVFRLNITIPDR